MSLSWRCVGMFLVSKAVPRVLWGWMATELAAYCMSLHLLITLRTHQGAAPGCVAKHSNILDWIECRRVSRARLPIRASGEEWDF